MLQVLTPQVVKMLPQVVKMSKSYKNETFDVFFILFDVLIFVVLINYFRRCDIFTFDVLIFLTFDVLLLFEFPRCEIRSSDPFPGIPSSLAKKIWKEGKG